MASLKSFFTKALLLALPLANALPTPSPSGVESVEARDGGKMSTLSTIISNYGAKSAIAGRYIVTYNEDYDDDAINTKEAFFTAQIQKRNMNKRDVDGNPLSSRTHSFRLNSWRAMLFDCEDEDTLVNMFHSDEVKSIELDTKVSANVILGQTNAPEGLQRISHPSASDPGYIFDQSSGEGITVFVLDTGIRTSHTEFGGRASWGANFVENSQDTDENGHGTHVAGTIGGQTYGVAKNVNLVAVKVLGANGEGDNSGVIQGMEWIISTVASQGLKGKAVMNMSLGGELSDAINSAIKAMSDAGIVPVVAAGNDNQNTKNSSPGSAPSAITVGAIDSTDARASFSNFGADVDIFAPGVDIVSCGINSDTDEQTMSGTSMASPHVAGLAAYLMAYQGVSSASEVDQLIKDIASKSGAKVSLGSNTADNDTDGLQATTTNIAWNGNNLELPSS